MKVWYYDFNTFSKKRHTADCLIMGSKRNQKRKKNPENLLKQSKKDIKNVKKIQKTVKAEAQNEKLKIGTRRSLRQTGNEENLQKDEPKNATKKAKKNISTEKFKGFQSGRLTRSSSIDSPPVEEDGKRKRGGNNGEISPSKRIKLKIVHAKFVDTARNIEVEKVKNEDSETTSDNNRKREALLKIILSPDPESEVENSLCDVLQARKNQEQQQVHICICIRS